MRVFEENYEFVLGIALPYLKNYTYLFLSFNTIKNYSTNLVIV